MQYRAVHHDELIYEISLLSETQMIDASRAMSKQGRWRLTPEAEVHMGKHLLPNAFAMSKSDPKTAEVVYKKLHSFPRKTRQQLEVLYEKQKEKKKKAEEKKRQEERRQQKEQGRNSSDSSSSPSPTDGPQERRDPLAPGLDLESSDEEQSSERSPGGRQRSEEERSSERSYVGRQMTPPEERSLGSSAREDSARESSEQQSEDSSGNKTRDKDKVSGVSSESLNPSSSEDQSLSSKKGAGKKKKEVNEATTKRKKVEEKRTPKKTEKRSENQKDKKGGKGRGEKRKKGKSSDEGSSSAKEDFKNFMTGSFKKMKTTVVSKTGLLSSKGKVAKKIGQTASPQAARTKTHKAKKARSKLQ